MTRPCRVSGDVDLPAYEANGDPSYSVDERSFHEVSRGLSHDLGLKTFAGGIALVNRRLEVAKHLISKKWPKRLNVAPCKRVDDHAEERTWHRQERGKVKTAVG